MKAKYSSTLAHEMRRTEIDRIAAFCCDGDEIDLEAKYKLFVSAHFGARQQQIAEHHAKHFRNVLDRKVLGRGRRLYKVLFIEEGAAHGYNERHAHWLIEKPGKMPASEFTRVFVKLWQEVCGSNNVRIEHIQKQRGGLAGLVQYLTKERNWRDQIGNSSFIRECSDNRRIIAST